MEKSDSFYSKDLGRKVLIRNPLYLVKLDLQQSQPEKKGSGQLLTIDYLRDRDTRARFLFALHIFFTNATLLARRIFLDHTVDYKKLKKYADHLAYNVDDFDKQITKKYNAKLLPLHFSHGSGFDPSEKLNDSIILKEYNIDEGRAFLLVWQEFLQAIGQKITFISVADIKKHMTDLGFGIVDEFTPRTTPENNPVYFTYLVFQKT